MPYQLENLQITSVDLVDQGANQEAHVCLMKRNFGEKAKSFVAGLMPSQKEFLPQVTPVQDNLVFEEPLQKREENMFKEETHMTAEEEKILKQAEEIAKKYHLDSVVPEGEVEKSAETSPTPDPTPLNPEVAKALAKNEEILKGYESKIERLEKSLAMERLVGTAKKYEILGHQPEELAEKLYTMEKSGAYEDYLAVLDHSLAVVEKSGMFSEVGKSGSGTVPTHAQVVEDVAKRDACSREMAFMKAYEENPDFAREYDTDFAKQ